MLGNVEPRMALYYFYNLLGALVWAPFLPPNQQVEGFAGLDWGSALSTLWIYKESQREPWGTLVKGEKWMEGYSLPLSLISAGLY